MSYICLKSKIYPKICVKAKYKLSINKRGNTSFTHFNDSKAFIEFSNDMDGNYKNIEECNPNKKDKTLIVFEDMIADMVSKEKLNSIVTELFIKGKELSISLVFITKYYFAVRLNSTHYFIMKTSNKREP